MKDFFCILIFGFFIFISAQATENRIYTVGVEQINYAPYFWINEYDEYVGLVPDVLKLFAESEGISFIYRPLPIRRLQQDFKKGELDFRFPDNPDWNEPTTDLIFSDPLTTVIDGLFVLEKNKGKPLYFYRNIGTISGYTAPSLNEFLKEQKLSLVEVNTYESLLQMLILERVQAAYLSIEPSLYILNNTGNNRENVVFDDTLPFDIANHYLSTKKHISLINSLNVFLVTDVKRIREIFKSYNVKYQ